MSTASTFLGLVKAEDTNNNYWCTSEPNIQRAWSASSLSVFMKCEFEYYLTYVLGWRGDDTPAQHFGKLYHESLEDYDRAIMRGASPKEAAIAAVYKAHELTWGKPTIFDEEGKETKRTTPEWTSDDNKRDFFTLVRSIVWYAEKYYNDHYHTIEIGGKPAIEIPFKIALPMSNPDGDNYLLTGFLDGAVAYEEIFKLVRERKSTGTTISGRFFERFSMDNQANMYTLAGGVMLGEDFHGILYDVCQTAVNFSEYARHEERRTDDQLEEWLDDIMRWIEKAERAAEEKKWVRNLASCGNYGGCVFRDYCSKSPSVRDHFMPLGMEKKRRTLIDRRGD